MKEEVLKLIATLPSTKAFNRYEAKRSEKEYQVLFTTLLNNRINHCYEELKSHTDEARVINNQTMIVWKDGHFSLPVFEELLAAKELKMKEWSVIIWQQIIRQMAIEQSTDTDLYYVATEWLLWKAYRPSNMQFRRFYKTLNRPPQHQPRL